MGSTTRSCRSLVRRGLEPRCPFFAVFPCLSLAGSEGSYGLCSHDLLEFVVFSFWIFSDLSTDVRWT